MSGQDQPLAEEGYALMGAAFEVHNVLGGGLLEEIYQQSIEIELELRGIPFWRKQELKIYYKGRTLEQYYIPDLFIHEKIVTELKATSSLCADHEAQLMNYMRITKKPHWLFD